MGPMGPAFGIWAPWDPQLGYGPHGSYGTHGLYNKINPTSKLSVERSACMVSILVSEFIRWFRPQPDET